jgi:NAD(P)-dependent dehydrogenase (short-subunit alcohol dehydrogenase family)
MRLASKVAVVTGAVGNIGLATTRRFLREGARVLMVDRDAARLEEALHALRTDAAVGVDAVASCTADVSSAGETRGYMQAARDRWGRLDVLFANAGIEGPVERISEYADDGFDQVMSVNAKGVFLALKYGEPFLTDGASVVLTSSVMGLRGGVNTIGYTASKHAVVGIMRSAAQSFGARGIRVNSVHPGFVDSDMLRRIQGRLSEMGIANPHAAMAAAAPLGSLVTPDDIADAVLFLASDESRRVTGQTLAVDGGYLL